MLDEADFYDMTRSFLEGGEDVHLARPEQVHRVLESLQKLAPEHARVITEYIRRLEGIMEAAR